MAFEENLDGSPTRRHHSEDLSKKKTPASANGNDYDDSTQSAATSNKSSRLRVKSPTRTREERLRIRAALEKARVEHLNFLNDPSYFRKGDKLHMIDKLAEELKQYLNAADITRVLTNLLEFLYDPSTRPEDPVDYFAKLTKEKKIDKRELNKARRELYRLLKKEYALKDEIAKLRKMLSLLNPVEFDEDGIERSPSQVAIRLEQIRVEQERKQREKDEELARIREQEMAAATEAAAAAATPQQDGSEAKSALETDDEHKSVKSLGSRKSKKSGKKKKGKDGRKKSRAGKKGKK